MKLGKSTKTNQFLESLKAEGEVIAEDLPLPSTSAVSSGAAAQPVFVPTDPITIMVEEKLMVVWKRDGGLENMEVQGTMALTVLKEEDAYIRIHVSQSLSQPESNKSKLHWALDIPTSSLENAFAGVFAHKNHVHDCSQFMGVKSMAAVTCNALGCPSAV